MGLSSEDDAIVAEMALRRGWIDRVALRRALEIQADAAAIELDERLVDILVTKGFITDRQAGELEEAVGLGRLLQPEHCHDIEGYRIVAKLGQGGMGAVFEAVELSIERRVALKVLSPELASDARYVRRFEREARTIGRVSHPNVVGGLDSGRSGDYHYYAMEYVQGRNLYEALADGPLPIADVLDIAEQMARALCHIESLGLVHRDIKPSNIILTHDGVARLCDLGLARAPEDPSVTDTGIPIGTPHYAAPELALGRRDADARSDIYALGGTLYHLVTGEYPFRAESGASLLQKHVAEPLRPPVELRPDMPSALNDLICRMMAKNPRERVQTAGALLERVEAIRAALPASEPGSQVVQQADLPKVAPPIIVPRRRAEREATPLPSIAAPEGAAEPPAADEAPAPAAPAPRLPGVIAWAAVYLTLLAILVVAVIWAVRSRRRGAAAKRPATQAQPTPASTAEPQPTTGRPASPAEAPAGDQGRALAGAALAFEQANPRAHGAALLKLRRAALAAPERELADRVSARLRARRDTLAREARKAYDELKARVQASRDRDEFGPALQACAAFPPELRYGGTGERLDADIAKLGVQAERRYLELATTGGLMLRQRKLDDGVRSYEKIARLGLPWAEAAAARLVTAGRRYAEIERRRLDEAARWRAVSERRRSFGQLKDLFAAASDLMSHRQYQTALARCVEGRRKFPDGALGQAVVQVEERVRRLADVWETLRKNPAHLRGKQFKLYGSDAVIEGIAPPKDNPMLLIRLVSAPTSQPHRRPLRKLPTDQFVQVAVWGLGAVPERDRATAGGLIYLAEGKPAKARQRLERASALGAKVAPYLRELEAADVVAEALKVLAAEQWQTARERLEKALDQYADTMAVVLDQVRLRGWLKQCVAELGETASEGPVAPMPLPLDLRRFVLLPETRFAPTPPVDPLEAYRGRPLRRGSPMVLGLDNWRDYTVELTWTPERDGSFLVLFRLSEPRPGQFTYYYLAFDGQRLLLGRLLSRGATALASCPCRGLSERGRHRAVITVRGSELVADVDRTYRLRASDSSLPQGNIALATSDARLLIHELAVTFPASKPRQP